MSASRVPRWMEQVVFGFRLPILILFIILTVLMGWFASQLQVKAGFEKQLPLEHPYIQTFLEYQEEFPITNRVLVALIAKDGDMFDAQYFKALYELTNEVFYIDAVNRASVRSIFTPNVRYVEVVEGGFTGGNVVPATFDPDSPGYNPTAEDFARIRANIVKSGTIGRLVAEDFSGAMVWASLLDHNPETGGPIDYQQVSRQLEEIRAQFENENQSVHIIGFAMIVGDIAAGATSVVLFFGITILLTLVLLYLYCGSLKLSVQPVACALVAVIWTLGALKLMGFGIDPMNILTPFLIFAIGVSHGVQWINGWADYKLSGSGADAGDPARPTFRRLLIPCLVALLCDVIGFLTILLIDIQIIRELAITASVGMGIIIIVNLILLPILLSWTRIKDTEAFHRKWSRRERILEPLWRGLAGFTRPRRAAPTLGVALVLLGAGWIISQDMRIGDSRAGVPELRHDARYNVDARRISEEFSLGMDQLVVMADTYPSACTEDHFVMETIDRFAWHMKNLPGVQTVISLPQVSKVINAGWHEGFIKWRVLAPNNYVMRQNLTYVSTDTGLLNTRCDVMPVIIFTEDHKAQTIARIVAAVKEFNVNNRLRLSEEKKAEIRALFTHAGEDLELGDWRIRFRLAMGNVGIMAASNEVVAANEVPILLWVYGAITALCLVTFKSIRATLCIIIPLGLVSVLAYALMALLDIGLKVNTLPVVALGVGIGVDYGIYVFSRLQEMLDHHSNLYDAYLDTLRQTGKAVFFTAITLTAGVSTWLFSELQFQADMGLLLAFMFLFNMVGAIILLPALASWLLRPAKP